MAYYPGTNKPSCYQFQPLRDISHLVVNGNYVHIASIDSLVNDDHQIKLSDGHEFEVSRRQARELREWLSLQALRCGACAILMPPGEATQ